MQSNWRCTWIIVRWYCEKCSFLLYYIWKVNVCSGWHRARNFGAKNNHHKMQQFTVVHRLILLLSSSHLKWTEFHSPTCVSLNRRMIWHSQSNKTIEREFHRRYMRGMRVKNNSTCEIRFLFQKRGDELHSRKENYYGKRVVLISDILSGIQMAMHHKSHFLFVS